MDLQGLRLTWYGHSTFRIETASGKHVVIDPWFKENPACPANHKNLKAVDVMLISHGHFDHMGDAVELAKKHKPTVIAVYEICAWLQKKGVENCSGMNRGGSQTVSDMRITMVPAFHSSGIEDEGQMIYAGEACGYVIEFESGVKIYHAGDTAVFGDMQLIHELYHPDIALLPIGDHYTMGPREATLACRLLRPKTVIPMHYGTFPLLKGTPAEFKKLVAEMGIEIVEMKPGKTI